MWQVCGPVVVFLRCGFFGDATRVVGTCRGGEECQARESTHWQCALWRQARERGLSVCGLPREKLGCWTGNQ